MMKMEQGLIVKGIGGFYYVEVADTIFECKARGVFRKNKITPMVGDHVNIRVEEKQYCSIEEILPRKNYLIRPPVANIDQLFIVVSVCEPDPNPLIIDKTIAAAEDKGIEPILVISKTDLDNCEWIEEIYHLAKIPTCLISSVTCEGTDIVREMLVGKISAFTGNSGVGKSSLLNCIDNKFQLQTGEISDKLGRGRHTTRQVELLKLNCGGYVADTPGFSSIDIEKFDLIRKENLQFCFREFEPYMNNCKFPSCSHTCEKGCAVIEAVDEGKIHKSRHNSYVSMYNDVKDIKEWQIK